MICVRWPARSPLRRQPEDGVVVHDAITSVVFDYYYRRCGGQAPWKIIPTYPSLDVDVALRDFEAEAQRVARLWFVTHPRPLGGFDPEALDVWARGHLLRLGHQKYPSIWLGAAYQLYTAHFPIFDALPARAEARDVVWPSDGLRLSGVDPITITAARDQAEVNLYWRLDQPAQRNFNITARLVDRSGAEWGLFSGLAFDNWSAKKWPVDQFVQQSVSISLPKGLPPGDYALLAQRGRSTNERSDSRFRWLNRSRSCNCEGVAMNFARWVNLKSIVLVFVVLAAIYSVATPIFEASDEVSHYAVVQHIADTGALAGATAGRENPVGAGGQPAAAVLPARVAGGRV